MAASELGVPDITRLCVIEGLTEVDENSVCCRFFVEDIEEYVVWVPRKAESERYLLPAQLMVELVQALECPDLLDSVQVDFKGPAVKGEVLRDEGEEGELFQDWEG